MFHIVWYCFIYCFILFHNVWYCFILFHIVSYFIVSAIFIYPCGRLRDPNKKFLELGQHQIFRHGDVIVPPFFRQSRYSEPEWPQASRNKPQVGAQLDEHFHEPNFRSRSFGFWEVVVRGGSAAVTPCPATSQRELRRRRPSSLISADLTTTTNTGENPVMNWMGCLDCDWNYLILQIHELAMDQYLYIPFLGGWTTIYQLFWGSLGLRVLTHPHIAIHEFMNIQNLTCWSNTQWDWPATPRVGQSSGTSGSPLKQWSSRWVS